MEFFDLYDRQGKKLHKKMARGSENNPGEYHKVVHIWIQNSNGKYLVQQRNKSTDRYPYQWAPTAGAVTSGEEPLISAIRETYEEIGIQLQEKELLHQGTLFCENPISNYIIELYLVKKDIDLNDTRIDTVEVKAIDYFDKQTIFKMIDAKTFWNFQDIDDYFSILEKR